jgi:hypothetical protein
MSPLLVEIVAEYDRFGSIVIAGGLDHCFAAPAPPATGFGLPAACGLGLAAACGFGVGAGVGVPLPELQALPSRSARIESTNILLTELTSPRPPELVDRRLSTNVAAHTTPRGGRSQSLTHASPDSGSLANSPPPATSTISAAIGRRLVHDRGSLIGWSCPAMSPLLRRRSLYVL